MPKRIRATKEEEPSLPEEVEEAEVMGLSDVDSEGLDEEDITEQKDEFSDVDASEEGSDEEDDLADLERPTKKPKKTKTDFADAMAKILGTKLKRSDKEAPILARSKGIEKKIEEEKLEYKARKALTAEKKKLAQKDRVVPDHTTLDYEKKLKKVATRGVVKLFNAIKAQQKEAEGVPVVKAAADKEKVASMSKAKFLDILKGGKSVPS
ncbi:Rrp15p-domain-containing protein [Basidiobolus meristosporus CBS 931.73]|uniref:Rrp15p-domain-containing protein n=1 Tax=Basidiobolus meristosporus CBS 931.73 TaxID=1314790 RepID=A0A1Y1XIG6_9FUNG|nr:Rrp15p-domain-containing protein [Basidiobolus meristosporus CBS 931.73]|eukprot:ORX85492.1 Rrp15p-domain-containing protein [Basidiobolus meristosporus CBS 931.73]